MNLYVVEIPFETGWKKILVLTNELPKIFLHREIDDPIFGGYCFIGKGIIGSFDGGSSPEQAFLLYVADEGAFELVSGVPTTQISLQYCDELKESRYFKHFLFDNGIPTANFLQYPQFVEDNPVP